jgi:hypothetical protein
VSIGVRTVPWLLALAGLVVPLVGSNFVIWPLVVVWLVVLALVGLIGRVAVPTRSHRIAAGLLLLPVLLLPLAWWGGWWLVPAALAWLLIEIWTGMTDNVATREASVTTNTTPFRDS